ncbi:hypothetical protein [Nocardia huaxiensis]|uniref:DUF4386 domain-containing protein n=1 Tax=Nocardia huaxiensis TaxID=2755382 RepID=A0A7D6VC19_9NOCA|nr:hypothetical protein [Nocardia huaxiensis]QLY31974.1 hypothetical protein H0264_06660 [Nocardia huaxiensis]UFS95547.1 hypothetical protein LPY97_33540 [Nocardia huaxiensis]
MTTTATPPIPSLLRDRVQRGYLLVAGGVLWSIGNALHPLRHSEQAEQAATWIAAHLTFSIGSVLIAAGLPAVFAALLDTTGTGWAAKALVWAKAMLFLGFAVTVPVGAYHEMFVARQLGHHEQHEIEAAAAPLVNTLAASLLIGLILLAVVSIARPHVLLGRLGGVLMLAAVIAMGAAPGLPGAEGIWIIPGTIVVGAVLGVAGWRGTRVGRGATTVA